MADQLIDKRGLYVAFAAHFLQLGEGCVGLASRAILREMAVIC
jgi:hypothetical protein